MSRRSWAGDDYVPISNTGKNSGLFLPLPAVGRFTELLRSALDTSGPVGELQYRVGRRASKTCRVRVQGGDPIRLRCHYRGLGGMVWFTMKVPAQRAADLLPVFEDEAARIAELG
ncbi:MAG: hypothetical protein AAF480_01740 [Actinomycetota bacterium]